MLTQKLTSKRAPFSFSMGIVHVKFFERRFSGYEGFEQCLNNHQKNLKLISTQSTQM